MKGRTDQRIRRRRPSESVVVGLCHLQGSQSNTAQKLLFTDDGDDNKRHTMEMTLTCMMCYSFQTQPLSCSVS